MSTYGNINKYGINNIPKNIIEIFNEANILIYHPVSDQHGKWHFKNILSYCNLIHPLINIAFTWHNQDELDFDRSGLVLKVLLL